MKYGFILLVSSLALAGRVVVEKISLVVPEGWKVVQNAKDDGTTIYSIGREEGGKDELITLYAKDGVFNTSEVFGNNGAHFYHSGTEVHGGLTFRTYLTELTEKGVPTWVKGFATQFEGKTYFGFSRSSIRELAEKNASAFLGSLIPSNSLTGSDYHGKKYYFGWGAAMEWDPEEMQNEVKYDVKHTHDIFTENIGGNYIGKTFMSYRDATGVNIKKTWKEIKSKMMSDDMYVQYSSGHGSEEELEVGVTYQEIRDTVLSMPAKEMIVFIMACHSGGLVQSFNEKREAWKNFQKQGRTLFVMSSSTVDENSSLGPSTDPEEPEGPIGSAGSAFGHALWKALIGHSDGDLDGVKDGFISLGEIASFTTKKTEEIGQHTPQVTGAYDKSLIMNRVPSAAWLAQLEHNSDRLSDEEVLRQLHRLDRVNRIR